MDNNVRNINSVKESGFINKIKKYTARGSFDLFFFIIVMALLTVGLVMMFSASYVNAYYYQTDGAFHFIKRQAGFAVAGIALMLIVSKINYKYLRPLAVIAVAVAIILLVMVLIFPYQLDDKEDFKRWLKIGIPFQPSEIAKLALVMFLAYLMERHHEKLNNKNYAIFPYFVVIGIFCVLIALENHISCTILVAGVGIAMTFLGGGKMKFYIAGAVVAIAAVVFFINFPEKLPGYAEERIVSWTDKDFEPLGARYQVNQSLYAIGSGGLFGLGFGQSKQKHLYIPEPQNDFIFSIVCEELGFIGATLIIVLFALLIWRGFTIGINAKDVFGRLLAMGIVVQIGLQTILNIWVVTDTMPNTGISLPFFSYGGTALLIQLIEMGIVLGVSRYSKITKVTADK